MTSEDIKHQFIIIIISGRKAVFNQQELSGSRGGRSGLPVPNTNSLYGLCGHKATFDEKEEELGGAQPRSVS